MTGDEDEYIPDVYYPASEVPAHPASGGGPYSIPDVAGETAEIADEVDATRSQYESDQENH